MPERKRFFCIDVFPKAKADDHILTTWSVVAWPVPRSATPSCMSRKTSMIRHSSDCWLFADCSLITPMLIGLGHLSLSFAHPDQAFYWSDNISLLNLTYHQIFADLTPRNFHFLLSAKTCQSLFSKRKELSKSSYPLHTFKSQLSADCQVSLPLVVQCIVKQYFNQLAVFAPGLLDSSERL